MLKIIKDINPELVWIGYDSHPEKNRLPEPPLAKSQEFIKRLEDNGISVHQKLIRRAWYEYGGINVK
jgi:adenine C2-methylase RlmN of 23S rRNA A2503 and tRNA A37